VDDLSRDLFRRWVDGDSRVAGEIVNRYAALLYTVVVRRLSGGLARRVDPEDLLQSVWKDFFTRSGDRVYQVEKPGDLRALLCTFARNKVRKKVRYLTQQKRHHAREVLVDRDGDLADCQARQLSPDDLVALADEVGSVLARLKEDERQAARLLLDGRSTAEIAAELGCAERTVRRKLERVRERLTAADEAPDPAPPVPAPATGADP
jgi:RNA polymerase sigma-70 factor (ECF subfamily)